MFARRRRYGFTLVELLVVIGIIAVLIGILLPVISRARSAANQAACMANLRTLGQLLNNYAVEFRGSMPYGRYYGLVGSGSNLSNNPDDQDSVENRATMVWWSVLRKYMKGQSGQWDNAVKFQQDRFMKAYACPDGHDPEAGNDYGCNPVIMPDREWSGDFPAPAAQRWSVNQGNTEPNKVVRKPALIKSLYPDNAILWDACEIPSKFDRQFCVAYGVDMENNNAPAKMNNKDLAMMNFRGDPLLTPTDDDADGKLVWPGPNKDTGEFPYAANIRWRHQKNTSANFLFGDWSVRPLRITEVKGGKPVYGELYKKNLRPKAPTYFSSQ
jgi:prepilin-type N-terminal cleavage/methylation domain-containing protein/prepilin-type processing-associated H-X9-DG protein